MLNVFRDVSYNDLTSLPDELVATFVHTVGMHDFPSHSRHLQINVVGNYDLSIWANDSSCNFSSVLGSVAFVHTVDTQGLEQIEACEMCGAEFMVAIVTAGCALYTVVVIVVLWRVTGADWRPDGRDGASCIILYGRCTSAHEAANNWFTLVQNHFDEDDGSVQLDHSGIDCADTVQLSNLRGKLAKYNQLRGTVLRTWVDADGRLIKALVSIDGIHKLYEFQAENLTKLSGTAQFQWDELSKEPPV
jgi:hypothetical protein